MNYNKVIIAGNLTRDAELRQTQSGTSVCNITIAVNEKQSNGETRTTFVSCDSFGKTAENISKYFSKGKPIFIEGRLRQDNYEDKNGVKQTKTKVIIEKFEFVGKREATNGNDATFEKSVSEEKGINYQEDDEVPF